METQCKTRQMNKTNWFGIKWCFWNGEACKKMCFFCVIYTDMLIFSWKEDGYRMQQDSCMRFIFQTDVAADRVANVATHNEDPFFVTGFGTARKSTIKQYTKQCARQNNERTCAWMKCAPVLSQCKCRSRTDGLTNSEWI